MSAKLRKPTESYRFTLQREVREVLSEEDVAKDNPNIDKLKRRVTLLVPFPQPQATPPTGPVFFSIDKPTGKDIAADRSYKLAPLIGGFPIRFMLQPQQCLYLMAEDSMAIVSAIVEYLEDP